MTNRMRRGRFDIVGIPCDDITMNEARAFCRDTIDPSSNAPPRIVRVAAINPEKVERALVDGTLSSALHAMDLLIPDGIGATFAARWIHGRSVSRVTGVDAAEAALEVCAEFGGRVFLLGATEGVVKRAAARIRERYPGISTVHWHHGYFADGDPSVRAAFVEADPDVVLVGMGSPRQELWVALAEAPPGKRLWMQCVGGTLDVFAGQVKRAPRWSRAIGMEWLYRLLSDPTRANRYRVLPIFLFRVLGARARRNRR